MLKKAVLALFIFYSQSGFTEDSTNSWSLPENYISLFENAQQGNKEAQEEISKFIYNGIIRYPDQNKDKHKVLYGWLNETNPNDSFARKVARFFFNQGNVENAREIMLKLQKQAKEGDMYAERSLGSIFFYTTLGKRDREAAFLCYRKAAEKGNARSQLSLALRYIQGVHVKMDVAEGLKWLRLASAAGLPEAQSQLADFYLVGENVEQDLNKSYELFLASAKGGNAYSQKVLAIHHLGPKKLFAIDKHNQEGIRWQKLAAKDVE